MTLSFTRIRETYIVHDDIGREIARVPEAGWQDYRARWEGQGHRLEAHGLKETAR